MLDRYASDSAPVSQLCARSRESAGHYVCLRNVIRRSVSIIIIGKKEWEDARGSARSLPGSGYAGARDPGPLATRSHVRNGYDKASWRLPWGRRLRAAFGTDYKIWRTLL